MTNHEPSSNRTDARHVLLVEDHPGDAQLTQDAFLEAGFPVQVQIAVTGEQALEMLRRSGPYAAAPRPDLIILDLQLPRMSGYDLLATLKVDDAFRRIPTIVFSGSDDRDIILRCYDLSVSTFVVKPSDWTTYAGQIRSLAAYWFGLARLPDA